MPSRCAKGSNSRAPSSSPPATARSFCISSRRSEAGDLSGALGETLTQVQGAFSLLLLTKDSLIGVRDPNGFRPLNIGKLNGSYVLASETCAFDLIGATYVREVEPGEIVLIRGEDIQSMKAAARAAACEMHFRTRLFLQAGQHRFWPVRPGKPRPDGTYPRTGERR